MWYIRHALKTLSSSSLPFLALSMPKLKEHVISLRKSHQAVGGKSSGRLRSLAVHSRFMSAANGGEDTLIKNAAVVFADKKRSPGFGPWDKGRKIC